MAFAITFIDDWESPVREGVLHILAALQAQPDITVPVGTVNLKLVDDSEIAALNEQYTGNAYVTDVLTFNYREADSEGTIPGGIPEGELADIAISQEAATRQAAEAHISQVEEVAGLALHGLLHVLGYDHQTAAQRRTLEQLQSRILGSAGFSNQEFQWDD